MYLFWLCHQVGWGILKAMNNHPAPQQGVITSADEALEIRHFELGNKRRQMEKFYFKSVDPDGNTQSFKSDIKIMYEISGAKRE